MLVVHLSISRVGRCTQTALARTVRSDGWSICCAKSGTRRACHFPLLRLLDWAIYWLDYKDSPNYCSQASAVFVAQKPGNYPLRDASQRLTDKLGGDPTRLVARAPDFIRV